MISKRNLLNNAKFYLILDAQVNTYQQLIEITRKSIPAGVDIIQLRDKLNSSKAIIELSRQIGKLTNDKIPFIINDRADIALASRASGVHLGQDDISIKIGRRILGEKAIIGASCQTFEQVQRAQAEGADYIGLGSVFKTLTKPNREPMDLKLLQKVIREIKIPVFAIGGIDLDNISELITMGVKRFAVCRAISLAEDVSKMVKEFKEIIQR